MARAGAGRAVGLLVLGALLLAGLPAPGGATGVAPLPTQLPAPRNGGFVIGVGGEALILGGLDAPELMFNLTDGSFRQDGKLPDEIIWDFAPAYDGRFVWTFGGESGPQRAITRFDPATGTTTVMDSSFPMQIAGMASVWTGQSFYLFGGATGTDAYASVYRYDPATDTLTLMGATLPSGRELATAAWLDGAAYVFGGWNAQWNADERTFDDILRYDPGTDTLTVLPAKLPEARDYAGSAEVGDAAYIVGGYRHGHGTDTQGTDTIFRFDPATQSVTTLPQRLPAPRAEALVGATSDGILVAGGRPSHDAAASADMVLIDTVLPGPPRNVTALAGPGTGEVALRWDAPVGAAEDGVRAYRIYRGTAPGAEALLAEVGADQRTFTDTGLDLTTLYRYVVRAVGTNGEGMMSNRDCSVPAPAQVLPVVAEPCPALPGWRSTSLGTRLFALATPAEAVTLDAGPSPGDGRQYEVRLSAPGRDPQVVDVYDAGLPAPPVHQVLQVPAHTASLQLVLGARADPTRATCLVRLQGQCLSSAPFDPADAAWLTAYGPKAFLSLEVRGGVDGAPLAPPVLVPFAGQAAPPLS